MSLVDVVLPKDLYAQIVVEAERMAPLETGGIFLGYQNSKASPFVKITHVIGPGPNADHGYNYFEPDYKFQSLETEKIYKSNSRGITYLGDWHTHPLGAAKLSWQDRVCLHKIANNPVARNPSPVMVILSGLDGWRPNAWIYRRYFTCMGWARAVEEVCVSE